MNTVFLSILIAFTMIFPVIADPVLELHCANAVSSTQLQLWFSEPLNPLLPPQPQNFNIPGLTIYQAYIETAVLGNDRVILNTSPLTASQYTVTVSGLFSLYGNGMNPNYNSFNIISFNQNPTYYSNLRWIGNSVGFGIWTIFFEPSNTIYNRIIEYINIHQSGIGLNLNSENFSVPGAMALDLIQNQLPFCLAAIPDIVLVEIGGNDWGHTPYNAYVQQMDYLYSTLTSQLPQAKIISANIYDAVLNGSPGGGGGYTLPQWNAALDSLGELYDIPILDGYSLFLGHSQPNGWYIDFDGLHPNTCGYVYLSTLGLDILQKLPPKPQNYSASVTLSGLLQIDCEFFPGDQLTTAVQIYKDGYYYTTLDRDDFPFIENRTDYNFYNCSYTLKSETDLFAPEIYLSAFTAPFEVPQYFAETDLPEPSSAETFILYPAYPNPFNAETTLRYNLPAGISAAALYIYNSAGQTVESFALNSPFGAVTWRAQNLPSGVYFAVLRTGKSQTAQKMMLMK